MCLQLDESWSACPHHRPEVSVISLVLLFSANSDLFPRAAPVDRGHADALQPRVLEILRVGVPLIHCSVIDHSFPAIESWTN